MSRFKLTENSLYGVCTDALNHTSRPDCSLKAAKYSVKNMTEEERVSLRNKLEFDELIASVKDEYTSGVTEIEERFDSLTTISEEDFAEGFTILNGPPQPFVDLKIYEFEKEFVDKKIHEFEFEEMLI